VEPAALAIFSSDEDRAVSVAAPVRHDPFADELNAIVERTCTPDASYKINMVGAELPWFNHNTLEMLAAQRYAESGRWCYYTSLGYAESDPSVAWKRVLDFKRPYFIGLDYGNKSNPLPPAQAGSITPNDSLNKVNVAV
jgi:hypothetical protein